MLRENFSWHFLKILIENLFKAPRTVIQMVKHIIKIITLNLAI